MSRLILSFFLVVVCASTTCARWQGPETVVSGGWGGSEGQFGFKSEDTSDSFPELRAILPSQEILIDDDQNERLAVYRFNGTLKKYVYWELGKDENGEEYYFLPEYGISTIFRFMPDGSYYTGTRPYGLRSSIGELLTTFDKRPLKLGILKSYSNLPDGGMEQTIAYEDVELTVSTPIRIEPKALVRDQAGFIYGTGTVDTPSKSWPWRYRVYKFDRCGKELSRLELPETKTQQIDHGAPYIVGEIETVFLEEYGPPVIGPDGSVYCWKRTPDTYSILKWVWADEPGDPKSECKK